jgi:hypothetical protein
MKVVLTSEAQATLESLNVRSWYLLWEIIFEKYAALVTRYEANDFMFRASLIFEDCVPVVAYFLLRYHFRLAGTYEFLCIHLALYLIRAQHSLRGIKSQPIVNVQSDCIKTGLLIPIVAQMNNSGIVSRGIIMQRFFWFSVSGCAYILVIFLNVQVTYQEPW